MADIDKISVNNTTYNIKDSTARESISKVTLGGAAVSLRAEMSSTGGTYKITITNMQGIAVALVATGSGLQLQKTENGVTETIWSK